MALESILHVHISDDKFQKSYIKKIINLLKNQEHLPCFIMSND